MNNALWHFYFYGFIAAMLLALGHDGSVGFAIFMGIGSWGSVVFDVLALVLP